MQKRGTGWIPDYPDIQDYTLDSLANQIQSQGTTASIDNLAQEISTTFNQFFENQSKYNEQINNQLTQLLQGFINIQTKNNQQTNGQLTQLLQEFINIQTKNNQQANSQLTQIRDNLEEKILGELRFVKVELHSVIEPGWAYSEVLLIKNYLQRIISTWKQFKKDINYQTTITNNIFDIETQETVQKILKHQRCLQVDGFVDKDDMEALAILAQGVNLDREKQFFKIIKKNAEKYTPEEIDKYKAEIDKYNEPNSSFPKNPEQLNLLCQGLLTVYLFPIVSNLPTTKDLLSTELDSNPKSEVQQELRNLENQIDEAKINLSNAVKKIENDRDFIEKIIEKFQASLRLSKYFKPDELMYLTDLTNQGEGLTKKIIEPLKNLLEQYSKFDKNNAYNYNYKETIKLLSTTISEFEKMMELLYMAYPPEIPSENFQKIEIPIASPIPILLVDLLKNKFTESAKLESKLLNLETKLSIQNIINFLEDQSNSPEKLQLIRPIIEVLVQILMPVGQYSNLSEAVEQGIERIWDLLVEKKDNQQEIQGLIRETIEEYNFGTLRNYSLMTELSLKELILTALQKFDSDIKQLKTVNQTQAKQGELQNIAVQVNRLIEKKVPGNQFRKPIKKPLFEITNLDEVSRKINVATSNPENTEVSKSKTSSQQKNILQFPLSSQVRKDIQALEKPESSNKSIFLSLPEFVDLTYWCSPVEDQGPLNSCTAHAGVALMEYAEKKSSDTYTDSSPLFLYRVTRNLMQREGDSGASVRDTIKAMVAFGVCPEVYWPYNEDKIDEEPTPFCYSFAENYKTIKYFRLDYGQISRYTLLSQVKVLLASEIPCIFGFTLYNSVYDEVNVLRGHIPLPRERSKVIGGHTVVAVGYHDRKIIENEDGEQSKGALLIRNSWGARWGQGGYGWLPYDYIMKGLTADWWSLLKAEWLATGRFGAGASAWNPDKGDRNGVTKPGQNG